MNLVQRYFSYIYDSQRAERRAAHQAILEVNPLGCFLDCGCREGNGTVRLAEKIGTRKIVAIDYNFDVLKTVARKDIPPLLSDLNCEMPLKDDCFDVIVASDIIEHLVEPAVFVAEMYRVLHPGGYVVLDTPNLASWHNIFALVLGIQPFSGPNITTMDDAELGLIQDMRNANPYNARDQGIMDLSGRVLNRHIVVLAYLSLLRLLVTHGFRIEKALAFGYYPLPPFLAHIFQRIDPRHAHHILVKARKPE